VTTGAKRGLWCGAFADRVHAVLCVVLRFFSTIKAIDYAQSRARFRAGEIRVLDSTGKLERTIAFKESDRKL